MTSVLEAATTYLFHSSKYKLSDSLNPSTYTCLLSNQKGKKELIYLAYVQQLRSLHTNQSPLNVPAHAAPITLTHKELPIWTNILHFVGYFRLTHLLFFACCIKRKRKKKLNSPRQPNERFLPPAFLSLKQIRTPSAASRSACCKIVEACSLAHIRRRTLRSTLGRDSPRGHGVQLPQYVRMSICLTYDFSAVVYCCVFLFFFRNKHVCCIRASQQLLKRVVWGNLCLHAGGETIRRGLLLVMREVLHLLQCLGAHNLAERVAHAVRKRL